MFRVEPSDVWSLTPEEEALMNVPFTVAARSRRIWTVDSGVIPSTAAHPPPCAAAIPQNAEAHAMARMDLIAEIRR